MQARHSESAAEICGVLLCPPTHFKVCDTKNDFMRGQIGRVDHALAKQQWSDLVDSYAAAGLQVHTLEALPKAEDMVFTANPSALVPGPAGEAVALLARMCHPSRQAEVAAHAAFWKARGVRSVELPGEAGHFEGHGDLLVVPRRRFALFGVGGRSEASALPHLRSATELHIEPLALIGRPFYHLDTALVVLDEDSVLLHPAAFQAEALSTLQACFGRCLLADPEEAAAGFACNSHALPDGRVLVPSQAPRTAEQLAAAGYSPQAVDVSEFHRSGGSIFCMKLELSSTVL